MRSLQPSFAFVLIVSETQQTFTVAKQFLTKSSGFFRKTCNGDWKENQTKKIELPDTTPKIFSIYLQWLYTGELIVSDDDFPPPSDKDASQRTAIQQYDEIIDVYIFADSILDLDFQNRAMDYALLIDYKTNFTPGTQNHIQMVMEGTMPGCPLRRYLVDSLCTSATSHWLIQHGPTMPVEFLTEAVAAFATIRDTGGAATDPCSRPKCHYHIHNDETSRCK